MDENEDQTYELKIRILGNEIFAIALSSSSTSNRWIAIALVSMFLVLTVIGAYGEKLASIYNNLVS